MNGFSLAQIVIGRNPKLLTLPQRVLQAWKRSQYQKHWPSILIIESESDRSLISALKQRIFKGAGDISVGDWIYYKNESKWEGLNKILSQDGKLLCSVRANNLLTINSHHVMLAKADDVFWRKKRACTNIY